ncbi:MAG: PqiC family protein [Pseudomonadota bacterium]
MLLLGAIGLAGCGSGPEPVLYTLDPPFSTVEATHNGPRISLPSVELPAYARSSLIASADGANRIVVDDDHRWASPPSESVTLALARHLESALDATVLVQPHPRGFDAELVITVSFDRFLRSANGAAALSGRAVIASGSAPEVMRFSITPSAAGGDYSDFMTSVDQALAEIANRVAKRVAAMPPP